MKQILLFILSTTIIVLNFSCNSTEPEKPIKYKDPRDMVWTVDTLVYPGSSQVLLNSIWASSPTDVYAVGHNESNSGQYWHYDGKKWKSINLFQYLPSASWNLIKVYGAGANELWIVGAEDNEFAGTWTKRSLILQHKNGWWIKHNLNYETVLMDITRRTNNEIWVCGRNGIVLLYDGNNWKKEIIKPKNLPVDSDYYLYAIEDYNNEKLLIARYFDNRLLMNGSYFIRGSLGNWMVVDSLIVSSKSGGEVNSFGNSGLYKSTGNKLYSYGTGGVWIFESGAWVSILKSNLTIRDLNGVSDSYLFALGDTGNILFYEGAVWKPLGNLVKDQQEIDFYSSWTNGEEIFLLGINNNKTYILHGK